MFNSGIKVNQRCNGVKTSPSIDQLHLNNKTVLHINHNNKHKLASKDAFNSEERRDRRFIMGPDTISNPFLHSSNINSEFVDTKVKLEPEDIVFDNYGYSIIDVGEVIVKSEPQNISAVKVRIKKENTKGTHHEALQRIYGESDVSNHYQHHWFSPSLEKFKLEDRSREERIEITRHEFRRHIQQLVKSNVGQPNKFHELYHQYVKDISQQSSNNANNNKSTTSSSTNNIRTKYQTGYNRLVAPRACETDKCPRFALPCTKHCTMHIMFNGDQVLFEYCTAKFADNTQCSVPVFDISHELPLCAEHARKRDNYKLYQEAKPKKLRKKVKPSAMIRPQKRNKKKKKLLQKSHEINSTSAILEIPTRTSPMSEVCEIIETESPELEVEDMQMVDQVLELNETGLEQALVTQAHLLEETDINNVLNTIQVDEFSDLFTVNRNGEYEPSREEAEELEKALAAVDNDVKSLEKLSQSQGLLDTLLDEHTLAETLVQLPEMFHHNGGSYVTQCGDNMVTQTASYLLPVEPHSHS